MQIRLENSGTLKKSFQPISLCMASLTPDFTFSSVSFLNQHVLSVASPAFASSVVRTQHTAFHDIFMQFLRSITQFNFTAICDLYGINNFYSKNNYLTSMQREDKYNRDCIVLRSHMKTYRKHKVYFESAMLKSTKKNKNSCQLLDSVYVNRKHCISNSIVDLKNRNWPKMLPAGTINISACPEMFSKPSCRHSADCHPTVKTDHNRKYFDEALFSNTLKNNSPEKILSVYTTQFDGGNENVDTNNNDAISTIQDPLNHHDSPPQSTTGSLNRQRNLSECSDESFICFIDDADNTYQSQIDSDIDENLQSGSESDFEDSEMEDNECDNLPMMQTINHENEQLDLKKRADLKKVRFNLKPKVYTMYTWNFAYRSARKGHWEDCARDRARFQQRIQRTAAYLNPVLCPEHRNKIYESRFTDQREPELFRD